MHCMIGTQLHTFMVHTEGVWGDIIWVLVVVALGGKSDNAIYR